MTQKIDLQTQITAVELELLSLKGHIDNLNRLIAKKQREQYEVDMIEPRVPALEAALATLRWVQENESRIKAGMRALKQLENGNSSPYDTVLKNWG